MTAPRKNPAAVALGRKGGAATSEAKAKAVRANGATGGRLAWAWEWRYGRGVTDNAGKPLGTLVAFRRRAERDAWVEAGPSYTTEAGYREVARSSDFAERTVEDAKRALVASERG